MINRDIEIKKRNKRVLNICSEYVNVDDQNGSSENKFNSRIESIKCVRKVENTPLEERTCTSFDGLIIFIN